MPLSQKKSGIFTWHKVQNVSFISPIPTLPTVSLGGLCPPQLLGR